MLYHIIYSYITNTFLVVNTLQTNETEYDYNYTFKDEKTVDVVLFCLNNNIEVPENFLKQAITL